jgi:ABC-type multidrug transport system permease subunit
VEVGAYANELFSQVQAVRTATRAQAEAKVKSGEVLAAVIIPPDIASRLSSDVTQASLQVLYDGEALQQSLVRSTIDAALAQANLGFSEQIQHAAAKAIEALLQGGNVGILGAPQELVGLDRIPTILHAIIARQPAGRDRTELERIEAFAGFAAQNLALSRDVFTAVGQPIRAHSTLLRGRRTPLDQFAVVVAVTVSLMFVCVLLAAGGLAAEREERALARLLRQLVSREALLAEKGLLAAGCSLVVALAMLVGIGTLVTLDFSRLALWVVALAFGALAFGALGVAIGALAREVRAASLLAFLLSLPLALLALVPAGSVSGSFYDAISAVSFVFPFKAALQALDTAVNSGSPSLLASVAHLVALTVAFGLLAGAGLRRVD